MRSTSRYWEIGLLVAASGLAAGCAQSSLNSSGPLAPTSVSVAASPAQTSWIGNWRSVAPQTTAAVSARPSAVDLDPTACGQFQWVVTSQTSTEIAGEFSATCGDVPVSGSAVGQLTTPTSATLTISGSGTVPDIGPCPFSITATGSLEDNDTLHLEYSGTSCVGSFSGEETLRRDDL